MKDSLCNYPWRNIANSNKTNLPGFLSKGISQHATKASSLAETTSSTRRRQTTDAKTLHGVKEAEPKEECNFCNMQASTSKGPAAP